MDNHKNKKLNLNNYIEELRLYKKQTERQIYLDVPEFKGESNLNYLNGTKSNNSWLFCFSRLELNLILFIDRAVQTEHQIHRFAKYRI